jgi:hypothetical protein
MRFNNARHRRSSPGSLAMLATMRRPHIRRVVSTLSAPGNGSSMDYGPPSWANTAGFSIVNTPFNDKWILGVFSAPGAIENTNQVFQPDE